MGDERPRWARRIRDERMARGWSQAQAVQALRVHSSRALPDDSALIRNWKRWESGQVEPDTFYRSLIAEVLGTVSGSLFPGGSRSAPVDEPLVGTGMDTLEIVSRQRRSEVSPHTLEALALTAERLCREYPHRPPSELRTDGQVWLRRVTGLLDQRLTLAQHREILVVAGWVALLVGCIEYDLGERRRAEATRRVALSLGEESGHAEIAAWAHEMRAWYLLTQGDFHGVVSASHEGRDRTSTHGVAVQLAAQAAKAWSRMGDRRQAEAALEQGRALLESLPYPANLDNHFVVDPAKFDFYAMDCYRMLGDDRLAEVYAWQVIGSGTRADGHELQPMRAAEARLTLAVVAARRGDPEQAAALGLAALDAERRSLPSLLMCSRELAGILRAGYAEAPGTSDYLDRLRSLVA